MNRKSILIVMMSMAVISSLSQQPLGWGDQLNGTYKNPVLNADYSDPDVVRVGDKYYMVASDFHFLGMQVLESQDMINWRIISQIYDRFDLPGWDENHHYAGGSWAPAIRYHEGLFYVFFCTPEEGLFMSTAHDARGPWSSLHCVKSVEKWEDPCPLWDDDGQAYLGRSQHGAGPIIVHRMSADGRQLLDDGVTVYTGPVAEGTKFLKRNGYYYLIIPEGGVGQGWQTVLRSRSIYGPYERRVVLEQGSTNVNGPHQGALVEAPDSTWWFYHFQETHPGGRVVHLQPARWKNDWLLMGVDIDGNGVGEPITVWNNPKTNERSMSNHISFNDNFNVDTLYWAGQHQRALKLNWQWNHNPIDTAWSLNQRLGWLTFNILPAKSLKESRNMLTQKTIGYESEAITSLDCSELRDGDHTGLLCIGKQFWGVGVCCQNGCTYFYIEQDGERRILSSFNQKNIYVRVTIDSQHNCHQFSVSSDGHNYTPVGQTFSLRMGYWKGSRVGLYSYNRETTQTGKVHFDYFNYIIKR